jgi:3-hydroxy-9,10-secoandrosta-1,3,5(10)-triene-9,17-dione monooxygenase reductase component
MMPIDRKEFRNALGAFATGVTIVTTQHDGVDVGLTANSFNSVSLDPPMVLWSLGRNSLSLPHFASAGHFAVHILADEQEPLSSRFAKRGADKFAGLECQRGHDGLPLLTGCVARFQCRKLFEYEGGDHVIFVGEVLAFDYVSKRPLLFHGGQYAVTAPRESSAVSAPGAAPADGLAYLVTRAYFGLRGPALKHAEERGINWGERLLLGALLDANGCGLAEVNDLIGYTGVRATADSIDRLLAQGYITRDGEYCVSMIARTKAAEAEAEIRMGSDGALLKQLLKRLADATPADERMGRHLEGIGRNIESFRGFEQRAAVGEE